MLCNIPMYFLMLRIGVEQSFILSDKSGCIPFSLLWGQCANAFMMLPNNSNTTDVRKMLIVSSRLTVTADLNRYANTRN